MFVFGRSSTVTISREQLLDNELLLRQTIVTSGVWLVFIGFGAYLNTGVLPHSCTPKSIATNVGSKGSLTPTQP